MCHLDLIEKMLAADPKERISLSAAMQHAWSVGECIGQ